MTRRKRGWRRWLGVAVAIIGGFLAVGGVLAVTSEHGNFEVNLDSHSFESNGTSVWTYTVEVVTPTLGNALSHQSIGINPDCVIVDPDPEDPEDEDSYYTTGDFVFKVTWGTEQNSGEKALKFEAEGEGEGPKQAGDLMTFTLTIVGAKVDEVDPGTLFTMKYGTVYDTALEEGPICEPTAVQLTNVRGGSGVHVSTLVGFVLAGIVVAGAGAWELRKLHQ